MLCTILPLAAAALLFRPNYQPQGFGFTVIRTLVTLAALFVAEPLLLHFWGTTPGKWLLGLSVESESGGRLSLGEAWGRTTGLICYGLGFYLPLVSLVTCAVSYQKHSSGRPLSWEAGSELRLRDRGRAAGVAGYICLCALLFFVAVILVIIGTYICFISGSVMFLQLLRKNRRYYYSKKHFVPVSGMSYRMKRNGAGLASICILSTMVVVTLSSVMSLHIGLKDTLRTRYCRDYIVTVRNCGEASADAVSEYIGSLISGSGLKAKNLVKLRYFTGYGKISGGNVDFGADGLLSHIYAVSAADAGVSLQEGCALVSAEDGTPFETLSFEGWRSYTVTGEAPDLPIPESSGSGAVRIVLPDSSDIYGMADFYSVSRHGAEEGRTLPDLCIGFDAIGSSDEKSGLSDRIGNGIGKALESGDGYESYRCTGCLLYTSDAADE